MIEYFNTEKKDLDENLALLTQKTENQNVVKETLLPPFIHQPCPPLFRVIPLSSKIADTPQVTQFFKGPTSPHLIKRGGGVPIMANGGF